jgi:hypothetical protein
MVHDEGFEDRSARFDQLMGIEGVADDDVELGDKGYDGFTDRVCCPDSVKFTPYLGRGSTAMLPDWRRGRETPIEYEAKSMDQIVKEERKEEQKPD